MLFSEFISAKIILTDQHEISKWRAEHIDDDDYNGELISMHIYGGSDWIEEREPGFFGLIIENTEPTGTLAECEKKLFDWIWG